MPNRRKVDTLQKRIDKNLNKIVSLLNENLDLTPKLDELFQILEAN